MFIPACALGFLVWANWGRVRRVVYVTQTDASGAVPDAGSPTGYAGGQRWLIVPERNNRSYQWIAETQQMLARHEWRVRHVDYDNAPSGRATYAASLYRWWLGLLAWGDHVLSGRSLGLAVERAALVADPALQLLLLIGTTLCVARWFGAFPAALLAFGLAALYPVAGGFLPGVPDDHSLSWAFGLWSVLPLLAAATRRAPPGAARGNGAAEAQSAGAGREARLLFGAAGVAGGLGLWISAADQTPVLVGIALGGILAAWLGSGAAMNTPADAPEPAPWHVWALAGAVTCLAAYLIEYFPAHMDFRLEVNHPLYGVAWLGAGELLTQLEAILRQRRFPGRGLRVVRLVLAVAAIAALPAAMIRSGAQSLLTLDPLASRLTFLPNGAVARNTLDWLARDGLSGAAAATVLPLLLLGPALWLLVRPQSGIGRRTAIGRALGPVLVTLVLACLHLRWWNAGDCMLLALLVASTAAAARPGRWLWSGLAGVVVLPGLLQLVPPAAERGNFAFTRLEVEGLIERALAHWIANHSDPGSAVILVPPERTISWCFFGGFRGLGSASWENRDGLEATIRIAAATTEREALERIQQHGITHIILPSWDTDLDTFARWTLRNPEDAFVMALHHWALPPWLRPLPYKVPAVPGLEKQSVVILQVTDNRNRPLALARLAEYFIESQQVDLAASVGEALQRYPADLGALVALAQVEKARGDTEEFQKTFGVLLSSVAGGFDRVLAWDRRVSLAVVLAEGGRNDLAREQVRRCLDSVDEARIRSLTTGSLFRLQVLCKAFALDFPDPRLGGLAARLLPSELRERL